VNYSPTIDVCGETRRAAWPVSRPWPRILFQGLIAIGLAFATICAHAADRVALVIGNGSYAAPLQKLDACPRDAAKMAAAFQAIGIRVYGGKPLIDLTADQMDAALNDFVRSVARDSEIFIYYSGHGAQIGGSNYLLPVGFNAKFESQARRQAVSLDAILDLLEKTESGLRVVILDSCRDAGEFLPGEPTQKGLVHTKGLSEQRVDAPETLVCFATKHGTAALADDTSSYYTRVLAEEIVKPGKVEDVMKAVARRVYAETNQQQLPFTYGSLLQDHYFVPDSTKAPDVDAEVQRRLQVALAAIPPATIPPPQSAPAAPALGPEGFFPLDRIFAGSRYAAYNGYSRGRILTKAQEKLRAAGIYPATPDGKPGRGTEKAILEWQRQQNIESTGLLDGPTLASLGLENEAESSRPAPEEKPRSRAKHAERGDADPGSRPPSGDSRSEFQRAAEDFERR